jgi:hypothetical protein
MNQQQPTKGSKMQDVNLTAKNLKGILWETLRKLKSKKIKVAEADAIAIQSREIVRVIRSQQGILQQANRPVTAEMISYAED